LIKKRDCRLNFVRHFVYHAAAVLQAALLVEAILEADPAGAQRKRK